ncbi:transposase [Chloroflexi bacterium TSY]|nr:transposase [Chloroflexi bacterium TSY]
MIKAHRIRLNPTPDQADYFWQCAGVARFTLNWALNYYNMGVPFNYLKLEFNQLRKEDNFAPFVGEVQSYAHQYAFRDLQAAINRYWKFKKDGLLNPPKRWKPRKDKKPFGWPRFKARGKATPSFGLANNGGMRFDNHHVKIQKCPDWVNMAQPLRFEGKVMGGRVTHHAGHWYLAVTVDVGNLDIQQHQGPSVGVDRGLRDIIVTSEGQKIANPKRLKSLERKLKRIQRELSRRRLHSRNWFKTKADLANLHQRIADQRREFLHELTTEVANTYSIICLEDLNIKGMMADRHIAQSVGDASMGEVARQLEYKAAQNGGQVIYVDRWFPSTKTCSTCQHIQQNIARGQLFWTCDRCGTRHDRDVNAAKNIRDEGLRLLNARGRSTHTDTLNACGDSV